jgi:AraC family transcriptional regulator
METLYIKNMVCNRCVKTVREVLEELGLQVSRVELGEASLDAPLTADQAEKVRKALEESGFLLLDDKRSKLINQIKTLVIQRVHYEDERAAVNLSDHIAKSLGMDYSYLSNLFSSVEGLTIEKYLMLQKTERVKELLVYGELSLSEIADKMGYSSVAHLSAQFKKITGLTPSFFRQMQGSKRKTLDEL